MQLIDLSHPLHDGQDAFPGDPTLSLTPHSSIADSGVNVSALRMGSHHGTHVDASFHCFEDGRTIAAIPLDRFYGPAALIDLAPGSILPAYSPLGVECFDAHADAFQPGAKIIVRTGWHRRFNTQGFYTDCPVFTADAARWIAERRIGLLGMDTPTPEVNSLECHRLLLAPGVEIVIVESLANLDKLPSRFTFAGLPLNLEGGDGSPIRAMAIVENSSKE